MYLILIEHVKFVIFYLFLLDMNVLQLTVTILLGV